MANPNGNALFRTANNPGKVRQRDMQKAIEAEFGEPLADVIQGMREQGYAWHTIAGALGIDRDTLCHWRHELGLPVSVHQVKRNRADLDYAIMANQKACELGYADVANAIRDMRLHHKMAEWEVAQKLGISHDQMRQLAPADTRGLLNFSPAGLRQRREQMASMRVLSRKKRQDEGHPWEKDNDIVFAGGKP